MKRAKRPPLLEPARLIDETMTVNRLVHEFPGTRRTLERLFVNIPAEGCTCLDEVAWRHGMEIKDLLKQLDQSGN